MKEIIRRTFKVRETYISLELDEVIKFDYKHIVPLPHGWKRESIHFDVGTRTMTIRDVEISSRVDEVGRNECT